ncbi:hypothetical protein M408DRAFT_128930 [Serendipita vermifera MAFF 305830]|uniref:Uncharacterized protein n=1 Tax=Serendipita vermifera MAFF 305830 TaxID=933852 RepID=A0A0C2W2E0_SERVB|nr:hypothetical protein M408DRAFT_128930 [Serendipita vermifera MAFF 305830]
MGNELSKPRTKNKKKLNSTTVTPVGTVPPHVQSPSTSAPPTRIVTQEAQSSTTQEAKPQDDNERNPTYQVTLDGSIYFFDTVRQISEATELLAPLKAVCGVIVKALETTRVRLYTPTRTNGDT